MIFETEHNVKLIQYLPEFVAEYKEIQAVMQIGTLELAVGYEF